MSLFKLDENLPYEVADLLRREGHDAATVLDQALGGRPDPDVAAACKRERRALVTLDVDFANVRVYPPESQPGIIVLRLDVQNNATIVAAVRRILPLLASDDVAGALWIVEHDRVRVWTGR